MTREEKYICLALGLIVYMKHKGVKLNNVFKEQDHPRDEGGRFTDGGGESRSKEGEKYYTTPEEIKEKQSKVKIDFTKDNYLPELNKEDLEELGKKSKPVLLKKNVIDRNRSVHSEVDLKDYEYIIGKALYENDGIFPANEEKPYFNFLAQITDKKSSLVLLDIADNKENFEIVHIHYAKNKQRKTLERKGEKIKK